MLSTSSTSSEKRNSSLLSMNFSITQKVALVAVGLFLLIWGTVEVIALSNGSPFGDTWKNLVGTLGEINPSETTLCIGGLGISFGALLYGIFASSHQKKLHSQVWDPNEENWEFAINQQEEGISNPDNDARIERLLEKLSEEPSEEPLSNHPMYYAIRQGKSYIVRRLLEKDSNLLTRLKEAETEKNLLQIAVSYCLTNNNEARQLRVVQELCSCMKRQGIDIHVRNDHSGKMPLHFAVESGNSLIVKYLIEEEGADVNQKDKNGDTPLHIAARGDSNPIVKSLIDKGANINLQNENGDIPLHVAAFHASIGLDLSLFINKTNVNQTNKLGETPLHNAAKRSFLGNIQCIYMLLEKKVNINQQDNEGNTPLHTAAIWKSPESYGILLSKGADHTQTNNDNHTPSKLRDSNWSGSSRAGSSTDH